MFASILYLLTVQLLGPGPPGSARVGPPLVIWVSSWTSVWLAIPTISAPLLPQHILKAGKIVGQRICGWFDFPVPPLEFSPGYRKWSLLALYFPLLRVLARVFLIDSWGIPGF